MGSRLMGPLQKQQISTDWGKRSAHKVPLSKNTSDPISDDAVTPLVTHTVTPISDISDTVTPLVTHTVTLVTPSVTHTVTPLVLTPFVPFQ